MPLPTPSRSSDFSATRVNPSASYMAVTMGSDEAAGTAANGASKPSDGPVAKTSKSCPAAARRFLLRLDNGALICDKSVAKAGSAPKNGSSDGTIVLMDPEDLAGIGRVKHDDLVRAYRCLADLRHKPLAPNLQINTTATKGPASKKPRTDGGHQEPPTPFSPLSPGFSSDAPPPADWEDRCRDMLQSVREHLGKSLDIFNVAVDPLVVVDYYKVVKNPMDLGTITGKLERNEYSRPVEFATDVRQVWYNCKLYNKKGDFVERTGTAASLHFEQLWASSGLAESKDRSRRANAGLAAAKFEPLAVVEKKKGKGSMLGGKGGKRGSKGTASSKKSKKPPMSRDQMAALAERLSEMDEDGLQPVVNIIRERNQLETGPDEEIELDIEALDNETLWTLDTYLKNLDGTAPVTSGAAWGGAGVDSATESDSSTDSDSD